MQCGGLKTAEWSGKECRVHTLPSSGFTSENSVVGENMLCQAGRSCYWRAKPERSQKLEDRPCSATGEAGGGGLRFAPVVQVYSCSAVSYCPFQLHLQIIWTQTYTSSLKSEHSIRVGTLVNPCRFFCARQLYCLIKFQA